MPSERRLHPLSFVFDIAGQVRQLVVPGLVVLVGAGSAGLDWQAWLTLLVIPYSIVALVRSLTFRYRFDPDELVITSGLIFRNERHVPYGRIQNIDAVQNVLHRLLRVVEVRVETGGGDEPEARMRVLPLPALEEMRARVLAGRTGHAGPQLVGATDAVEQPVPDRRVLLALGPRELLLAGFIDSRGLIIVGAAFGLLWEVGLFDPTINFVFGEDATGRGAIRQAVRALLGGGMPSIGRIAVLTLAFAAFTLVMRVLSMGWSLIRLWGFRLNRVRDDLGTEFGLFTRVMATIPLRRIQTVTVRESPLHRLFKTAAIRVDSAGGTGGAQGTEGRGARRESLAPIVNRADVSRLLAEVLPDVDVAGVVWRSVDPRGFRRALRSSLVVVILATLPFILMLRWWTLAWLAVLVVWAWMHAALYVKHLGWAVSDQAVLFRSGYLSRELTVARFNKIQAVTLGESLFDRRARMASVRVDTAGAADASHRVAIPYLARQTADDLYHRLAGEAARTAFKW
jgi:putative membrane protein